MADTTGMSVISSQVDLLAKLLDVAGMRHRLIAQNVANANTPNYHQADVSFEEAFVRQLGKGNESAALRVTPQVMEVAGNRERADGNNVDIDGEMGRLHKNALLYNTYVQILSNQLAPP